MARRAGAILAVLELERSPVFCRDRPGFEVEAVYGDIHATRSHPKAAYRTPRRRGRMP